MSDRREHKLNPNEISGWSQISKKKPTSQDSSQNI